MDTTILLAFIAMFGMGLNAIGNKMAAANGVYAPPFLLIVNIMYCVAALVLHSTQKQPFEISTRMIWLGFVRFNQLYLHVYCLQVGGRRKCTLSYQRTISCCSCCVFIHIIPRANNLE